MQQTFLFGKITVRTTIKDPVKSGKKNEINIFTFIA